jgi:hypothetical protein
MKAIFEYILVLQTSLWLCVYVSVWPKQVDPRKVIAVIFSKSDTSYKLWTKDSQLIGQYTWNQFEISENMFMTSSNINMEIQIYLR